MLYIRSTLVIPVVWFKDNIFWGRNIDSEDEDVCLHHYQFIFAFFLGLKIPEASRKIM